MIVVCSVLIKITNSVYSFKRICVFYRAADGGGDGWNCVQIVHAIYPIDVLGTQINRYISR